MNVYDILFIPYSKIKTNTQPKIKEVKKNQSSEIISTNFFERLITYLAKKNG